MQSKWYNSSGQPLSSSEWLRDHHKAKLLDRKEFIKRICKDYNPKRIIDLGCATGLWLDLFDEFAPKNCEFIGIDTDKNSIAEAEKKSKSWNRKSQFIVCDIVNETDKIPEGDLFLAFNMFSYITNAKVFLETIQSKMSINSKLVIRQYDGNTIRFGPMKSKDRLSMDNSLYSAIGTSQQFHHYDLDRVYSIINHSSFNNKNIAFETFQRSAPFHNDFIDYFQGTIEWYTYYLSEYDAEKLQKWYKLSKEQTNTYFLEVDLTAILS